MKPNYTLLGCLTTLLLPLTTVTAKENTDITFTLSTAQRSDVDFDTHTDAFGIKAITPYGLITCEYGRESGNTRIDTFDNIFGTQSVLTTAVNGYDANLLQCGYGIKLPLAGGELSGGLGMVRYRGKTDSPVDGKEIEQDALSLKASYERSDYTTRMQLLETRYSYLYHHLSGSYDSLTDGRISTLVLQGDWGPVYAELEQLHGNKEKYFTAPPLPLPDAGFDYDQLTVSLGPAFNGRGVLRYLAPTYTSGSERGSFNRLTLDSGFRGLIAGLGFGETTLRLSYLELQSAGRRDYSPVTSDMAETQHSSKLSAALEAQAWSLTLENNRSVHHGTITVTDSPIPYTLLTGCASASCDYDNVRREGEWKLSGQYRYSSQLTLQGQLYQRERTDQQFEVAEHNYRESGGKLGIAITF
jgi:hypothetical protein